MYRKSKVNLAYYGLSLYRIALVIKKEIDMEIMRIIIITSIILFVLIIAIGTYLIIVGGNMNKTKKEREYEDEEQMKTVSKTR